MHCDRCRAETDVASYNASYKYPPSDVLARRVAAANMFDLCEACVEDLGKWLRVEEK